MMDPRDEVVARTPDGQLVLDRLPLPTLNDAKPLFASLAKAYPYLADHAPHIDGEFNNALTDLQMLVARYDRILQRAVAEPVGASA